MAKTHPLVVAAATALAIGAGCGPNNQTHDADAGVDQGDMTVDQGPDLGPPPRRLISDTVWQTMRKLSPAGGVEAPTDSTNRYADHEGAARLGQYMFFEPAISGDGEVSCASCHEPDTAFTDETPLPENGITGPENAPGRRTPSLLNVGYFDWYFWDGRVDTLWGQAVAPYESPIEMGGTRLRLAHYVYDTPDVRLAYENIFGALPPRGTINPFPEDGRPIEDPTSDQEIAHDQAWDSMEADDQEVVNQILVNVMKSIAAYQMKLVSFNAPFDEFVQQVREAPDDPERWDAISPSAQEGMRLFIEVAGCLECHKGPHLTDNKFHNVGVPATEWSTPTDEGRSVGLEQARDNPFSSAGEYSDDPDGPRAALLQALPVERTDLGAFRTPTLRNVATRPPYMHAGQLADLTEVIEFYNDPPEGAPEIGSRDGEVDELELGERELGYLVEFLKSLTGEPIPQKYKSQPDSPTLDGQ